MKKLIRIFLVMLLVFSMFSFVHTTVNAGYCEDPMGNPLPPELCPG